MQTLSHRKRLQRRAKKWTSVSPYLEAAHLALVRAKAKDEGLLDISAKVGRRRLNPIDPRLTPG
jgi:hypothetical protein